MTETANDWPQIDSGSGHDLFGGDLFGDELMDIYNSAAVVDGATTDVGASEIPHLVVPTSGDLQSTETGADAAANGHPGAQVAMVAAAMDDGLGAFRPSTSFNDLTSLLAPSSNVADTTMPPLPVAPTPASPAPMKKGQKKREAAASSKDGPTQKKRATGQKARASGSGASGRRGSTKTKQATVATSGGIKIPVQSAGQAALKLRKDQQSQKTIRKVNGDTPNPLMGAPVPAAKAPIASKAGVAVPPVSIKPVSVPLSAATPATVTPRTVVKTDSITSDAAAATAAAAAVAAAAAAAAPPAAPVPGTTTEADFKSVAQAAVTNLILNAKPDAISSAPGAEEARVTGKVDTSTAHIKALTSSNWVTACAGGADSSAAATAAAAAAAADSKANNRARRQNLTPDERARQNRDRNREHARNTRLRKKAYVEELKRTLTELVAQRDAAEIEKRHSAQREFEQREVRFRVMEEFLKLRGRNEANFARWVAILEDGFTLTLPATAFRTMVHGNTNSSSEQILNGPEEVMSDSANVAALLQTLGKTSPAGAAPVSLMHHCERKDFFMDGCHAVLEWSATSLGATNKGASSELSLKGTMHAKFCPASNKLVSAKIFFDTGNVASQLQRLASPTVTQAAPVVRAQGADASLAAQAAANEADALLDSIQMPQLAAAVPAAITVLPTAVSVSCSEKEDSSSDEDDVAAKHNGTAGGSAPRRSTRKKE